MSDDKPATTDEAVLAAWQRDSRIGTFLYVKFTTAYIRTGFELALWPLQIIVVVGGVVRVWAFGSERSLATGRRRGRLRFRARIVDAIVSGGFALWWAHQHNVAWVVLLTGAVLYDVWQWTRRDRREGSSGEGGAG